MWGSSSHLLWLGLELLGIDVVPDLLHVRPVGDHPVLHRVPDLEQAPVFLGLGANEVVALQAPASHHPLVLGLANAGWAKKEEEMG